MEQNVQDILNRVNAEMEKRYSAPVQGEESVAPQSGEPTPQELTNEPVVQSDPQESEFDFTMGEIVKPEIDVNALEQRLKQLEEENSLLKSSNPFADERVAKINEYVKSGGEINETFWKLQAKDYSKIDFSDGNSLLSAIKDKYTLVDGFTEKEADRLIQKNFPNVLAGEDADPDDLIDEMISLKSLTKDTLPKLIELQQKAALPNVTAERMQEINKNLEAYRAQAITALRDVKTFEYSLAEGVSFKIGVDENNYSMLKDLIANPEKQESYFVDNYRTKEGGVNFKQFAEDEYFRVNKAQILKAVFAKGLERGKSQAIRSELLNERPESKNKRPNVGGLERWQEQNMQALKKLT
jgi:hypothetical protein